MAIWRGAGEGDPVESEPVGGRARLTERRRSTRGGVLGLGTLACPECDAPALPAGVVSPADRIWCAYCEHRGTVRDFLSLEPPTRPTRVVIRIVSRPRARAR